MISDANPYNPLLPTENPDYFINRGEVFAFFRQNLVGTPHHHAIALIGWRGLGKSSVLHQLSELVDDRYRPCIVPLGAYDLPGETELLAALVDEIRLMLERAEVSTLRLPEWPDDLTGADLRDWFDRQYLDIVLAALRHRRLLLVLDDAHTLLAGIERGALPGDMLAYFTDLLAAHDRLDIICAVDAGYEDQALATDLLRDPALHLRLTELEYENAERLIREPVQDVYDYEEGVVERILALAGGHPFLIHSICRLLFRRSEERNHNGPVTEHDLDAIDTAVLEQADEIFNPLWQGAPCNERLALSALVALQQGDFASVPFDAIYGWLTGANFVLNKTQLAAALRGLDYKGLVKMDTAGGSYRLPADLIAGWVRANAALPDESKPRAHKQTRWLPLVGLIVVLALAAALGAGAVLGLYGDDDENEPSKGPSNSAPTATLSLNLDATRQSIEATQTEDARPTATRTPTQTPTATHTPTITPSPTRTPRPTITPTITRTLTPRKTTTPTVLPTNTPRPSRTPTLDPGR